MNLLGKAADPGVWRSVREKDCFTRFREGLHSTWKEKCENVPIEVLPYSKFKLFFTTGDRSVYQAVYFRRRLAMNCCALLSLIYPEEEKYIARLHDEIYAICDEYTWCLPAHQGQLDKNDNVRIDLFASETGSALSEISTLLGDRLEPLIRDRIRAEIDRRIIIPYTSVENYSWWEKGTNNWTAVCTGSVGCTFMLMRPELFPSVKPRFDRSMESFLSGFSSEGFCFEGCGYWHYGFGFFTVYAEMLRTFTNGECDYFKRDDIRRIATFIQKMFINGRAGVSFSDGGRTISYRIGLLHFLKNEYPDDVLVYSPEYSNDTDSCGRWCLHLRAATWFDENIYSHPDDNRPAEYHAPDAQWFIKRNENYGFAAKGGCNAEHHNHNDVGSFIFAKNGRQLLVDMGSGKYTRQYFNKDTRYTMVECSSRGHSVPIIDGNYQKTGKIYSASDIVYGDGTFSADIAGAYGLPELRSLTRRFNCTDSSVTLHDAFDYTGNGTLTERIVALALPVHEADNHRVLVDGAEISYDPVQYEVSISSEPKSGGVCYLIDFRLKDGVRDFSCTIK